MSYLVDALKKAERERHASQVQDIHLLSTGPGQAATPRRATPWLWLVAMLVATNVALAIYVWRPHSAASSPASPMLSKPPFINDNALIPAVPNATPAQDSSADAPQPAPTPAATADKQLKARRAQSAAPDNASSSAPASGTATDNGTATSAGSHTDGRHHGRVVHSKTRLTGDGSSSDTTRDHNGGDVNASDTPDQSALSNVPSVEINGQLYSTVPGRSFILVNGRRYHEGERLAAGPAIESIDPNGATLRYHGQSYHVAGPS